MKKEYDFGEANQGPVVSDKSKVKITMRIDKRTLDWFKHHHEKGYQTAINQALQTYIQGQDLRRIIREELDRKLGKTS